MKMTSTVQSSEKGSHVKEKKWSSDYTNVSNYM